MNTDLTALKPALVWKHFAAMTQIPRPSFHEEKIRRYVLDVARSLGLECREDAAHNVYVRKPASKGMENRAGVILQAHLDMVPQKNNDKKFDFLKDPIRAYVDGDWVTADGTTLGADNGIGAAAILAVLEDDTLEHGPLEALFTAWPRMGAGQSAPFDAAEEQLNQRFMQRKKALEQDAVLYPKLGVLAAAAALLLLI